MTDLKSMFTKMGEGAGDANSDKGPPKAKVQAIEKIYQKKSQLEHILLRPDTYIGSVEKVEEDMWVYDSDSKMIVQKKIEYVPGLYKIFDEILVNAADNKQNDAKMDCIKVEINAETNTISIYNNGKGIPVVMHKDENMYVPTMIFGHLLTSSNYNDEEEKVTGGRNGYGAKLCNIFSTKFVVETANRQYKKQFKQTWGNNMSKASDPKIKEFAGEDYTKITFCPDLTKFKMTELDEGIVGLMSRRAFDVAASTRGVKVFLNGQRLPVKNFKDYVDLYIKDKVDCQGNPLKIAHEVANERWEVALTVSDRGFQQMSFVNSIATTKGGRHVDYVAEMIAKQLIEVLKKKNKGGIDIKQFQVKNHMWIFINCLIVNPTYDSQTKEHMTLQTRSFGSKCVLSEKFINQVMKSGIVEAVLSWAKLKAANDLAKKQGGKKQAKLKGIPKLEDANEAGGRKALQCTLILTEGDSAKTLAVSGLGVIGRDFYGVFPLRGKLLNVREATHKQVLENQEINNLVKIIGLQHKKKYNSEEDMKTLRYGKIMIMTDQDQDGSHIKGLIINFIHCKWPELLKQNFIEEFITPIVKATKKGQELSFYSLPELEEWRANTPNHHTYNLKYYKGLGTSTSKEAKEYFTNMARHRIRFRYNGQIDDDHILLAFSKKHIEHRKEWLTNFMVESKRRKEMGLSEKYLYTKETKFITYSDFVNLELVLFSNGDNVRSIPCLVDGFKPGQRKVLFTCLKRNDKREVKVAQLAGSVAEMSAYHHGEVSLAMTIVNLAQNFVGSNNINILEPRGQFGTRLTGGKDSASARYIFTKLSPMTRMIFHINDDPLLKHEYDDSQKIEPVWYIPILPLVLVNGADGIGTGWMTKIPNYNPREIVQNLRLMIEGEEPKNMMPWYKNFNGTIEDCGDLRYIVSGEVAIIGDTKIEITELPVGTWTQNYKESVLEVLLHGNEKVKAMISDYKEYNTDTTVKFVITVTREQMEHLEKEGIHKVFKLQSVIHLSSMCVFDELGCLRRFTSAVDIMKEFYTIRAKMYQKRKDYLEGVLGAESEKLSNQARFIMEKCNGDLTVENKKRKTIVDELIRRGYAPDPVKEWQQKMKTEADEETPEEEQEEESDTSKKKPSADPEKAFRNLSEVKKFDYLLGMSMWMLTDERKNELLKQRDNKVAEMEILKKKTPFDLWREDLDAFIEKLDEVEEKERNEEAGVKGKDAKKTVGRKKINLQETMPSPMGRRIEPVISDELKKKIQSAIKSKENKGKRGIKKENIAEGEDADEFDLMMKNKKTIKQKLGTPEEVEKKARAKKAKDGLKQSKLNFKKLNGTPKKKKKGSDDDDDFGGSDLEIQPVVKERLVARRAATKSIQFINSSDEDKFSDDEQELRDNEAVKKDYAPAANYKGSSESEEESPPPRHETSEDMFDSLVGRKKDDEDKEEDKSPTNEPAATKRKKSPFLSDSEDEMLGSNKITINSDSDDFLSSKKPKTKKKKADLDEDVVKAPVKKAPSKKKKVGSSDDDVLNAGSDDEFEIKKSKPKKKKLFNPESKKLKAKKKKADSDLDDDFDANNYSDNEPIIPPSSRQARAATQKSKYVFDESGESD